MRPSTIIDVSITFETAAIPETADAIGMICMRAPTRAPKYAAKMLMMI